MDITQFEIEGINPNHPLSGKLKNKIDQKTKPLGALGYLEDLAFQIALVQNTLKPKLTRPRILVFAADHGIAKSGVTPYPQEVTYQMVMNFLNGGAAINVFSNQNGLGIDVIDAGVNFDFGNARDLVDQKVDYGTKNFLIEPAMSLEQYKDAIKKGSHIIDGLYFEGTNIVGFGEMGIGNTSSASCLMNLLTDFSLEDCVGPGSGLDPEGVNHKISLLDKAIQKAGYLNDVPEILTYFGGFEIVQIVGGMLRAAEKSMLILVDGFIVSAAFLAAVKMFPKLMDFAIFTHQSDEKGHELILKHLKAKPLLSLGLRLGEGTGCALAYPIVQAAVNFLNEMASFEGAGVSNKEVI